MPAAGLVDYTCKRWISRGLPPDEKRDGGCLVIADRRYNENILKVIYI